MDTLASTAIGQYLDALASGEPVPGGGAAAALSAAQAAALLEMVLNVSQKHESTVPLAERKAALKSLSKCRASLLELADSDSAAFTGVMQAYKLPRGSDEEKAARKEAVEAALKNAAEAPAAVIDQTGVIFSYARLVIESAKPSVITDAAIALHLAWAALRSSQYNVRINLNSIQDEEFISAMTSRMDKVLDGKRKLRRTLLKQIKTVMGN